MTFLDHVKELRYRLIFCVLASLVGATVIFSFYNPLIRWVSWPMNEVASALQQQFFITSFFEAFVTKFKFSLIGGFVIMTPVHIFHILRFSFPGLKPKEKRVISATIFFSFLLACLSFYFGFFKLIPFSVNFLTSRSFVPENVGVLLNFHQNLFYVLNFLVVMVLLFQLPIILEILLYFNLLSRKQLWKASRYIVVGIFLLSAMVTPPDIVSQLSVSLPLTILFFLTLFIAKLFKFGET